MKYYVEHFAGEYYIVQYSFAWWRPVHTIEEPRDCFSNPSLWRFSERLFDMEEAKAFIAEHPTAESLKQFLSAQYEDFIRRRDECAATLRAHKRASFEVSL